jgi:hypothetical protein
VEKGEEDLVRNDRLKKFQIILKINSSIKNNADTQSDLESFD